MEAKKRRKSYIKEVKEIITISSLPFVQLTILVYVLHFSENITTPSIAYG